ncbi:hypothetical protein NAMH_0589 [Nautilia profundicola AmH]|uniref:Uncharacterized protein n=1 Tax=Nautilia profundicola (strain ATCC BAA-1463 / DSM 18972 / AmH) TaxID=598659 RepID=B9L8P7_NAUPA|nr:hypothetical protein [Nautilia profundicola]ACM92541.1 hypothetical protein NAMH_0589 [Nautilia profundicola AmH]
MATLPITSYYYPLTYLPSVYNTQPVTFNPEYIENLISLRVTDYFSPTQFATNPLFASVDTFNQNVGILQTAVNSLEKVLTLTDTLKEINNPTQEIIDEYTKEINDILQNTTFDNLNVFNQTLDINGEKVNLSIPLFDPNTQTIEEYTKLVSDKYNSLFETLQNISFTLPIETTFNPYNIYYPTNTLSAYNLSSLTPQTLELLLL